MEILNNKNKIISYLSAIESNVKLSNILGYYDIDRVLEDIIAKLLNIIFDYNLINANRIEKNFPAIDLIDKEKKIAIQVTADNSCEKINYTFEKFRDSIKNLPQEVDTVKFFMLKGKLSKYSNKKINKTSKNFNITKDILDFSDITKELERLDPNKLLEILNYLETIYINKPVIRLNNIKKIERNNNELDKYINRFVINTKSAKNSKEKLIDVIEENNKVVLLSDAGKGKTIEIKKLLNDIENKYANFFPFYCNLNTYVDQDIIELIPIQYKDVYIENIVFVLDALDEIEEKNKNTFARKLESFCNEHENIKIIITCRNNFYINKSENYEGTLKDFNEYILCDIEKENINELLKSNNINLIKFWDEVKLKNLDFIIFNMFYLNEIIDIYCNEKKLPTKENLMDYIIDRRYTIDINKYRTTINLNSQKDKMEIILKKIALALEFLEKNYLTEQEYNKLVSINENRELLKYSSLLIKSKNGNYSFIHNNFGEYLAAKKLSEYNLETIKDIVTYENLKTKIKPSWINTLNFLVNKYKDIELINWIISCMPEFVVYIENDVISIEKRKKILRDLLEKYNDERVWLPYNIRTNNLINDVDDLKYIMNIIKQNKHYTNVGNALFILESTRELFEMKKEIKNILLKIIKKSDYSTYNKALAINALANLRLGTYDDLIEIINFNIKIEDSILRKSYFYYCNTLKIINESIEIFIVRWDSNRNMLKRVDDIYSFDETQEVYKAFESITNPNTLNKALDFFETLKFNNYNEEDQLVVNLCNSIFKTYKESNNIIDAFIRIYSKIEEQYYYATMKAVINIIESKNMLLDFFKQYMKLEYKQLCMSYDIIIDGKCMEYYYNEYSNYKFKNQITKRILRLCDDKIKYYKDLKVLYEKRTKKEFEKTITIDYNLIRMESQKIFIEKIFNKKDFIELVKKFINEYGKNGRIHLKILKNIRRYDKIESNVEYKELLYFLCNNFSEYNYIDSKLFENLDWDFVILDQIYHRINDNEKIDLNLNQIEIIKNICNRGIKKCNFRDAQKKDKINLKCLYYWFFRNRYNFEYPEEVLLDMLEFEFSTGKKRVGFEYITKSVEKRKIYERVEDNLNNRELPLQVFENHIEYSINNNINNCTRSVVRYLKNRKKFEIERILAGKYLIKYMKLDEFINKYFINLEIKMQRNIIDFIMENNNQILNGWLTDRLKKTNKIENKMFYAQYLILADKKEGYEYYIEYLKKNNRSYNDRKFYSSINEKISHESSIVMLKWIIEIIQIIINQKFKDYAYGDIYNNVRKAIINIGTENINNFSTVEKELSKIFNEKKDNINIGMISYIIKDLENEYCEKHINDYNIYDIKKKLYELDIKKEAIDNYL